MGPVVDVEFENNDLPFIKDALEVYSEGKRLVMEVAQHIGNNTVRCIMLGASEGLCKDMDVIATGKGIQVPVGNKTLGRLFNVLGETIDGGESLEGEEHWVIQRSTFLRRAESCSRDAGDRYQGYRSAGSLCKRW